MDHVALASTAGLVAAIGHAREVRLSAFVLNRGSVESALAAAARRGADVAVTLAGDHFAFSIADIRHANSVSAADLRRAGATVRFDTGRAPNPTLHAKMAVVDGVGYLDERNWPDDGADTIVRDDDPADVAAMRDGIDLKPGASARLETVKAAALAQETAFVRDGPAGALDVETESFSGTPLSAQLSARAAAGDHVRLMVVGQDIKTRSSAVLAGLQHDGVEVRVNPTLSSEKAALAGDAAWVGSTNATAGLPHQVDWGMVVHDPGVVRQLRDHYEQRWSTAAPFQP